MAERVNKGFAPIGSKTEIFLKLIIELRLKSALLIGTNDSIIALTEYGRQSSCSSSKPLNGDWTSSSLDCNKT